MRELLGDRNLAHALGAGARRRAMERFGIARFVRDWDVALAQVTGERAPGASVARAA
jgi:hypothetical protein